MRRLFVVLRNVLRLFLSVSGAKIGLKVYLRTNQFYLINVTEVNKKIFCTKKTDELIHLKFKFNWFFSPSPFFLQLHLPNSPHSKWWKCCSKAKGLFFYSVDEFDKCWWFWQGIWQGIWQGVTRDLTRDDFDKGFSVDDFDKKEWRTGFYSKLDKFASTNRKKR